MAKKLTWKTEKRRVGDLTLFEQNPRRISELKKEQLTDSVDRFGLVEIPVINSDGTVIAGNQRVSLFINDPDVELDVRVPSRKLTQAEIKEYNLISNTHSGEWDFEALELNFEEFKPIWHEFDLHNAGIKRGETVPGEKEALINPVFYLNVECDSEAHCQQLYERLSDEGLTVKIIT